MIDEAIDRRLIACEVRLRGIERRLEEFRALFISLDRFMDALMATQRAIDEEFKVIHALVADRLIR